MGKQMGRPPKPVEQKRRAGNPGKRPLPEPAVVLPAAMVSQLPEPHRPLGSAGRQLWDRVWLEGFAWVSPQVDVELLQMVCEQVDERQALRVKVLRDGEWRERLALRQLDRQVLECLSLLGFTPVDRARLGFVEVKIQNELDAFRDRKRRRVADVVDAEEVPEFGRPAGI